MDSVRDLSEVHHHGINSGVLQGSISGPVLFILFIDELLQRYPNMLAFADDLALVVGREDLHDLEAELGREFRGVQRMVEDRRLEINTSKTKVLLFRDQYDELSYSDRKVRKDFCIQGYGHMNGRGDIRFPERLEVVESSSLYLGDHFLKFHFHV